MNDKRKTIFREAVFVVPFLLLTAIVSVVLMFFSGRSVNDMAELLSRNVESDKSMQLSTYSEYTNKKYTLKYYYGDNSGSVEFAKFEYNAKGDNPISELTLFESRDGFEPGDYKIEWFHEDEFVTFTPLDDKDGTVYKLASEVPLMYELINSYSWEYQMSLYGASFESFKGYKLLGAVSFFTWSSPENRQMIVWGLGGKPRELYSYLNNSDNEYKKIIFK